MNRDQFAQQLRDQAFAKMWEGDAEAALELYEQALLAAESEEVIELITIGKAEALIALDREGAEVSALPAIVMRRRSPRHVCMAAAVLMRRLCEQEDRKRAIFYGQIAREVATELNDPLSRASILNSLGITLTADSQFGTAITTFAEALSALGVSSLNQNARALQSAIVANLGGAKVLSGSLDDGIFLLESSLEGLNESYERAEAYLDLCFGYLELDEHETAERYGREALALATIPRQIRNANHLLGELAVRTGRYEDADSYFEVVAGFYPQFSNVKELLTTVDLCAVVNWKG